MGCDGLLQAAYCHFQPINDVMVAFVRVKGCFHSTASYMSADELQNECLSALQLRTRLIRLIGSVVGINDLLQLKRVTQC
jgi:hypothetical protein